VLLALAGQSDKAALIADGVDVYRDMAVTIFGLDRDAFLAAPKNDLTVEQVERRQVGKNTVLGCGYGMGDKTFRSRYLRHLDAEEAKTFDNTVVYQHYREAWAPCVPKLWKDLERTARRAMQQPEITAKAQCGVSYTLCNHNRLPVLVCRLLNGKLIHYQNAHLAADFYHWTYWAYRRGQWREVEPYGGQLTENVVQALARELLVDALLRFEARGYPVVMHCHDEVVVEDADITKPLIEAIMAAPPDWAAKLGVPISVEGWVGKRYRK
jgi:DNA polymerase